MGVPSRRGDDLGGVYDRALLAAICSLADCTIEPDLLGLPPDPSSTSFSRGAGEPSGRYFGEVVVICCALFWLDFIHRETGPEHLG